MNFIEGTCRGQIDCTGKEPPKIGERFRFHGIEMVALGVEPLSPVLRFLDGSAATHVIEFMRADEP